MIQISDILFDLGSNLFLEPYLRRQLTPDFNPEHPTPDPVPTSAVQIFHNDGGRDADSAFLARCSELELPVVVISCPNIIATGMNGRMRHIAEKVYNGGYFHIKDCEGTTSVVHAVDVARAAQMAAGTSGSYTLTDGRQHSIHDVAEALAYRIDNKRLFSLPQWAAKWWYSRDFYEFLTSNTVEIDTFAAAFADFSAINTLEYLHTHIYDDASL